MIRHNIQIHFSAHYLKRALQAAVMLLSLAQSLTLSAQINIVGSVYGAGEGATATVSGNTAVEITDGVITNGVFGGACMANVGGYTYVYVHDYTTQKTYPVINYVYGGNDIAGTISNTKGASPSFYSDIASANKAASTPFAYVRVENPTNASATTAVATADSIVQPFIGSLYGGGNGEYVYTANADDAAKFDVKTNDGTTVYTGVAIDGEGPHLASAYVDVAGGTIAQLFGGGNSATLSTETDIYLHSNDNVQPSTLPQKYFTKYNADYPDPVYYTQEEADAANAASGAVSGDDNYITTSTVKTAGVTGPKSFLYHYTGFTADDTNKTVSYNTQFDRVFGGNNNVDMAIRPVWHLVSGKINNVYSGGNKGDMTYKNGIILPIMSDGLYINNAFGGCRISDVSPSGSSISKETFYGHEFDEGYAARVFITGGHINNVYGGNDISGTVKYGTAVAIEGAISGNVYGGGNGSYAYTDNPSLKDDPEYGDYFYDVEKLTGTGYDAVTSSQSVEALNAYRPHVEKTLLHVWGGDDQQPKLGDDGIITTTDALGNTTSAQPVIVTGGVYCGGNSATLNTDQKSLTGADPSATFRVGKNVVINSIYLGSNGENMVSSDILKQYKSNVTTLSGDTYKYSKIDLTAVADFATYMKGVAVDIMPNIEYQFAGSTDPHAYIGSIYCGGNVGSMTYKDPIKITIPQYLRIYDRIVGGCNNADIAKIEDPDNAGSYLNAAFEGGVITENQNTSDGKTKVTLTINSYLEPRELVTTMKGQFLESAKLYWDTRKYYALKKGSDGKYTEQASVFTDDAGNTTSVPWILYGANVFGGCYTSGHIQGDVAINVTKDLISPDVMQNNKIQAGTEKPCNDKSNFLNMGDYVFAKTLTIYGGGYGTATSIRGNVHINLSDAARVLNVLGGADFGTIGCKPYTDGNGVSHAGVEGNTVVTVASDMKDYSTSTGNNNFDSNLPYNVMKIYGGAYAGVIYGHTELHLNGGTFRDVYGGSCNADIADYTTTYIGDSKHTGNGSGFPYIHGYVFGGNDFGGYIGRDINNNLIAGEGFDVIKGYHDFTESDGTNGYGKKTIRTTRYVEYNSGRIGYQYDSDHQYLSEAGSKLNSLYGGSYGSYDYSVKYMKWNYLRDGKTQDSTLPTEITANNTCDFDPEATVDVNHMPLANEYIPDPKNSNTFVTNTYVNIASTAGATVNSTTKKLQDDIANGIFGGGRGVMDKLGIVDAKQTYVYLHSASWSSRKANLVSDIFGGGYYSVVDSTKVDAETGCANIIYGGSYGTTAATLATNKLYDISYDSKKTEVNLYNGMDNDKMVIFGGGGYAGALNTYVNLLGGTAANVYGGSYNEGFCKTTHVNVPATSTASVNAIFGGGYGNDVAYPCDEETTNVNFASSTAYVADVIYGGNNAKRAAKTTNVVISAPVKTGASGTYVSVCGAGNGQASIAGYTNVTLNNGARVKNVYGGGRDGKVYGFYKNLAENIRAYYDSDATYDADTTATKRHGYAAWKYGSSDNTDGSWEGTSLYTSEKPASGTSLWGYYTKENDENVYTACASDAVADGVSTYYKKISSTYIVVNKGATAEYVYGGGYGAEATVTGSTRAHLHGGTVTGDIFGGGLSGNVVYQSLQETDGDGDVLVDKTGLSTEEDLKTAQVGNIYTYVCVHGGSVSSVYGGGYDGQVGSYHNTAYPAETRVEIGEEDKSDFYAGNPVVLRSAYGGGYRGAILGTAKVQMLNGYVGYKYVADSYEENLKSDADDTNNKLKESGNIFCGGFGEGATTDHTILNMIGGQVRNSIYGGGEIASIGVPDNSTIHIDDRSRIPTILYPGSTQVNMYGGLVLNNVFGGGRGYAIDAYGATQSGEKSYSDGYTFGTTNVNIYRGTVGNAATVGDGNGNVFGGGNIGYCYSAAGEKQGTSGDKNKNGYYYDTNGDLTEDCKTVISPCAKVTAACEINGHSYKVGDYVPTEDLNTLTNSSTYWDNKLDNLGVNIGNAVFAGGNVSSGSDKVYANTKTVYGNATASITDIFDKDFIVIGEDGIGGLYGEGNLTFVDGYRELNITNYGTDYYNLNNSLTYAEYQQLSDRERAYFELQYQATTDHTFEYYECTQTYTSESSGKSFRKGNRISASQFNSIITDSSERSTYWSSTTKKVQYTSGTKLSESDYADIIDETEQAKWELHGFCTLYAGRMINTIQRADFCGIFGSRIVMRGAQDRVPSVVDYTDYTINRVDEISLNQKGNGAISHGNYFGIYNVVNYLGALTSDVDFQTTKRTTDNSDASYAADGSTYYAWKQANLNNRKRNNGTSPNEVALASGVWLEILDKSTETAGSKQYGPITGVVQLDLINVATGEGGGYVYAKNQHGIRNTGVNPNQSILAASNEGAISYKLYTYADVTSSDKMQTSGNFVNGLKRIIDDCYPTSGKYYGSDAAPAHYWYIRGEFYVYDQYISAYTGSSQAYAENVSIPLTITAEAQGKLRLTAVEDNYYAYWDGNEPPAKYKSTTDDDAILINGVTYKKNDPITYWDWSRLTTAEQNCFTKGTYACTTAVTYTDSENNTVTYAKGDAVSASIYDALPTNIYTCVLPFTQGTTDYVVGQQIDATTYGTIDKDNLDNIKSVKECFNVTNAVSHANGFLLTFDWDNPAIWDDYYHNEGGSGKVTKAGYNAITEASEKSRYITSPSFLCNTGGVYGQLEYTTGDIIGKAIYDSETTALVNALTDTEKESQATFKEAYVCKTNCKFTLDGKEYNYVVGSCIDADTYTTFKNGGYEKYFERGYLCGETYEKSSTDIILYGTVVPESTYSGLPAAVQTSSFSAAYICTSKSNTQTNWKWGGTLFVKDTNYPAVQICNLTAGERANFTYNYDALDLLSEDFEPKEGGDPDMSAYHTPYYETQSIDYTATYNGADKDGLKEDITKTRNGSSVTDKTLESGDVLANTQYEKLTNEQFNYTPIVTSSTDDNGKVFYVVNEGFQIGDNWYSAGNQITEDVYETLEKKNKDRITTISRSSLPDLPTSGTKNYYFCTKTYTAVTAVTGLLGSKTSYAADDLVAVGTLISDTQYDALVNEQKNFEIDGTIPTETSTLYVSRETDIDELSQDKIVTAVYWYEYIESDESGSSYETIRERHIVNIHIHFESGVPTIGTLVEPNIVLPGTVVGLNQPTVTKGAYEILGGGWEMYSNETDAESHKNGTAYTNSGTPMYYYQDGYYVAYYAKSYLGKTYSNPVKFRVANYHRMEDVMTSQHQEEILNDDGTSTGNYQTVNDYMYLDECVKAIKNGIPHNNPRIYINDHTCAATGKTEIDYFHDFADYTKASAAHTDVENIQNCEDLEFILQSGVTPKTDWTSIGANSGDCFAGTFHGNGNTISGLKTSLFNYFCGNIYNTGVAGSFTGAGIADNNNGTNGAYNCWALSSAATMNTGVRPVFGADAGTTYNCYYYNNYDTSRTGAIKKSADAFLNGEVAYNLNSFFLNKRYYDANSSSTSGSSNTYKYKEYDQATSAYQLKDAKYPDDYGKYVETYYGNSDFIYAGGVIPTTNNIRLNTSDKTYSPIYPDDYTFFGQSLSYNLQGLSAHDEHPNGVTKDEENNLLIRKASVTGANTSNSVYRTPAYYMSKNMSCAYFNLDAAFAATYTPAEGSAFGTSPVNVYDKLTAIDFTGYTDNTYTQDADQAKFFTPYTDYEGLLSYQSDGLTQNVLVYADPTGDDSSYKILGSYLSEPDLVQNKELTINGETFNTDTDNHPYNNVEIASASVVRGHLIDKTDDGYVSSRLHFLVDKQNFNCPIQYTFNSGKYMWYQRTPERFADGTAGWETICLPFTADLVTTQQKGEITHFYGSDNKSAIGHEYWLRGFHDVSSTAKTDYTNAYDANFYRPMADGTGYDSRYATENGGLIDENVVKNTFLWDYYYSQDGQKDANKDLYQKYYDGVRNDNYVYYAATVPYIVAFPGNTFYEFDMSGTFKPENSYATIGTLSKQTVTWVSKADQVIAVSDNENRSSANGNYIYRGFYQTDALAVGSYVMNEAQDAHGASGANVNAGSHFDVTTAETSAVPFRAYFLPKTSGAKQASELFIGEDADYIDSPETNMLDGTIQAYGLHRVLHIISHVDHDITLPVYTTSGQLVQMLDLKSGAHEQIQVAGGVYLVNGRKVVVTK